MLLLAVDRFDWFFLEGFAANVEARLVSIVVFTQFSPLAVLRLISFWRFVELLSVPLHKIESCDRANDPINGANLMTLSVKVANKLYKCRTHRPFREYLQNHY